MTMSCDIKEIKSNNFLYVACKILTYTCMCGDTLTENIIIICWRITNKCKAFNKEA